MSVRMPTPEQAAVLNSPARVRVVRAAPGSGKTWLVAELIRRELQRWPRNGSGIAALSFTRVGGEEICKAVGYDLDHPHFVGTIDAFVFRHVVRPFLQRSRPGHAPPRLIPAEWSPSSWTNRPGGSAWVHRGTGGKKAKTYNLFDVCFVGSDATGLILAHPRRFQSGLEPVASADRNGLLDAKRRMWQRLGWVTHSDAAFIASQLLAHATHGTPIRRALLRRFPLLIVDELQDTGYFLGECIRTMLSAPSAQGVLVGDPRQAIYEFNGARPDLFDTFKAVCGASELPLAGSRRCPTTVTACANHLADPPESFESATGHAGRAFLVRYGDMVTDVKRLVGTICSARPAAMIKVIARHSRTVEELTSRRAQEAKSLYCPALHHLYRGVRAFRQGQNQRALAGTRAALELALFSHEGTTDEQIQEMGIDVRDWKALAVRCLLACDALPASLSLYDWQSCVGTIVDAQVASFGLRVSIPYQSGSLKPQKRNDWARPVSDFLPTGTACATVGANVPVQTVHAVKGETHDMTIVVCPPKDRNRPSPTDIWWTVDEGNREERRVGYVAMTRTRSDLVLCVSDACYQRLREEQATFVGTFQCVTVDECIEAFAATGASACTTGSDA